MQNRLSVINTVPGSSDLNVKTDSLITIYFDKDVSKSSINGNILVINGNGDKVDCLVGYSNKIITVTPRVKLLPSTSYRVIVKGNNDPNNSDAYKGITSPIGEYILGDYTFSFSTESPIKETEFVVDMSPNNIAMEHQPVFNGNVTNSTINVPKYVDIEVSYSNTFEAGLNVWSGRCNIEDFKDGVSCDIHLGDGTYYWRARAVGEVNGVWCETCQFAIEKHASSSVVADDYVDIDVAFPESWDMMDASIIGVYPNDLRSNVPTNLKTISIVLDKIVPEEELRCANISISGEPVDNDSYESAHGDISIDSMSVVYDNDNGHTILIFTLPVLETGGDE